MSNKTLITAQTDAVAADINTQFKVTADVPVTISSTLLAGAEQVDFTYSGDGGTTFTTATVFSTSSPLVLTASAAQVQIVGEGIYRVAKDATVGACAVDASPFIQ